MSTAEIAIHAPSMRRRRLGPIATLARRRFQLTARTPRELFVPLLTPIMFALVIAPALKTALHTDASYESFVAIGTVGLLIPLNTMFSGLSVIVDRVSGAQRELLTAPIPRGLLVLGNLLVALAITGLQVGVLIAVAVARGIHFDATAGGILWFAGAAALFTVGMYGMAEILPLTHGLALMRYGLRQDGTGLHAIWGMSDPATMAALSLAVVGGFALVLTVAAIRVFSHSAVR